MDWFSEPLKEVFGIPSFWISRSAKIMQFFAGAVILVEIIGKERAGVLAELIKQKLSSLVTADPIKTLADDMRNAGKYYLLYISTLDKQKKGEYYKKVLSYKSTTIVSMLSLILSVVSIIIFYKWKLHRESGLIWKLPLAIFVILFLSSLFVFLIFLNIVRFILFVIFRPIEWLFDLVVKFLASYLEKDTIVKRLLIISFVLLIVSFLLDLLVT